MVQPQGLRKEDANVGGDGGLHVSGDVREDAGVCICPQRLARPVQEGWGRRHLLMGLELMVWSLGFRFRVLKKSRESKRRISTPHSGNKMSFYTPIALPTPHESPSPRMLYKVVVSITALYPDS